MASLLLCQKKTILLQVLEAMCGQWVGEAGEGKWLHPPTWLG